VLPVQATQAFTATMQTREPVFDVFGDSLIG
jgi:hypothetical protein